MPPFSAPSEALAATCMDAHCQGNDANTPLTPSCNRQEYAPVTEWLEECRVPQTEPLSLFSQNFFYSSYTQNGQLVGHEEKHVEFDKTWWIRIANCTFKWKLFYSINDIYLIS